jgi:hypothetical protein
VDAAIQEMGAWRRRVVGMPYFNELATVAQTRTLSDLRAEMRESLVREGLVYEYFDTDFWYDVAPLVAPLPETR